MLSLRGFACAVVALACLAAPVPVSATLISVDTAVGPGTGVKDSITGNVWLKFSAQPNITAIDLPGLLAQPQYAGFRLATFPQIDQLFLGNNLDQPILYSDFQTLTTLLGVSSLHDPLGEGFLLRFGAVANKFGPDITVIPINPASGDPTGAPFLTPSHIVYTIDAIIHPGDPDHPEQRNVDLGFGFDYLLPDVFKARYVLEPGGGFPNFNLIFNEDLRDQGFEVDLTTLNNLELATISNGFWLVSLATQPVPEPQTLLLLVTALGMVGAIHLRRRQHRTSTS